MKKLLFSAAVIALVGQAWAQDGMKPTTVMPEALNGKTIRPFEGWSNAILVGDRRKRARLSCNA